MAKLFTFKLQELKGFVTTGPDYTPGKFCQEDSRQAKLLKKEYSELKGGIQNITESVLLKKSSNIATTHLFIYFYIYILCSVIYYVV